MDEHRELHLNDDIAVTKGLQTNLKNRNRKTNFMATCAFHHKRGSDFPQRATEIGDFSHH